MKRTLLIISAIFLLTAAPVFADAPDKPFVTFKYGASASWLTRIIEQTGRSNFVFEDFLPGLYFAAELQNATNITPKIRVAAYYPLISEFNDVQQLSKTPLHFAGDLFAGAGFDILEWNVIRLNAGPGLHMFFMTADRWNYLNLGIAATVGVELAISSGWTLMIDGFASIDNANLGTNKQMEPFDIAYQYQAAVGVRYSKKMRNNTALIMPKEKSQVIIDR